MTRLEIRESQRKRQRERPRLYLDGSEIQEDGSYSLRKYDTEGLQFILNVRSAELSGSVCQLKVTEFSDQIIEIYPTEHDDGIYIKNAILRVRVEFRGNRLCYLFLTALLELSGWKKAWSPGEFIEEMYGLSDELTGDAYIDEGNELYAIEFSFLLDEDSTIDQELERRVPEIAKIWDLAEKNLQDSLNENSIVSQFDFPSEIRSACEEYLLSFIQFLKDVGVEATADLKHEGMRTGQVLFSVTPANGKEALEKIRQALDVYLKLAGAANFEYEAGASLQVDRLESRILFFQSQLKLAQAEAKAQLAEVQRQEKTIEAQEATIQAHLLTLGHISANNVFLQTRLEVLQREQASKDELEFFGGLVTFNNPEFFGFTVNLARLIALLKPIMIEEAAPLNFRDLQALPPASDE